MGRDDLEFEADSHPPRRRPIVRFAALGEGWELFKERWGTWTLATLVVLACNWAIGGFIYALFRVPAPGGAAGFRAALPPRGQALQAALSMIVDGVLLGGMFRMSCRQIRGLATDVATLFSITDVLVNLVLGAALYGLACSVGFFCLVIPGFIVSGVLMFTFPLIVDAGLAPTEAIAGSWHALKDQWFSATLFHLVAWILAGVGTCFCCIGLLFTAPLYALAITVLYREFFLADGRLPGRKPRTFDADFGS